MSVNTYNIIKYRIVDSDNPSVISHSNDTNDEVVEIDTNKYNSSC